MSSESDKIEGGTAPPIDIPRTSPSLTSPKKDISLESELRCAMEEFYKKYNPERMSTLDHILTTYKGNEMELIKNLKEKYNVPDYKLFDDYLARAAAATASSASSKSLDDSRRQSVSSTSPLQSQSVRLASTAPPAAGNPNAAPILSSLYGMQDMSSRFLSGWGVNTGVPEAATAVGADGMPKAFSSTDELLLTTRVNSLQKELQTMEAERNNLDINNKKLTAQVTALRKDNTVLKQENGDLKSRADLTSRGFGEASAREAQLQRELQALSEGAREGEGQQAEARARVEAAERQKQNKHAQLAEAVQLGHRLDAQARFLMARSFSFLETNNNNSSGGGGKSSEVSFAVPEGGGLTSERFEQMLASLPGVQELRSALSTLDTEPKLMEERDRDELLREVVAAGQRSSLLESSFLASRLELLLEAKQRAAAEERLVEQQREIEVLQKKLSNVGTELETAFGSADTLKNQILDAVAEVATYKSLIATSDEQLAARVFEIAELRAEVAELRNDLAVSTQARLDLTASCSQQIRDTDAKANEYVRSMKEALQLEREEVLSKFHQISLASSELRIAVSVEAQRETQKLRDELFKARRNETQKEREIAFLQRQLVEAAKKVAQATLEREAAVSAAASTGAATATTAAANGANGAASGNRSHSNSASGTAAVHQLNESDV